MRIEKELIQKLKTETKNNPAANPVWHLLALRRRSRGTITVGALSQKMRREGFQYTNDQYRALLDTMSRVGVGECVKNRVGNCVGIKNIKVNLAALGAAACSEETLASVIAKRSIPEPTTTKAILPKKPIVMSLSVVINGKSAKIEFPSGLSPKELNSILVKLQDTPGV